VDFAAMDVHQRKFVVIKHSDQDDFRDRDCVAIVLFWVGFFVIAQFTQPRELFVPKFLKIYSRLGFVSIDGADDARAG
jgi:hypothetical protein